MTYKEHREKIKTREFCKERARGHSHIIDYYIYSLTPFMDQAMKDFFNNTETIDIDYEEVKEQPEKAQIKRLNP